MAKKAKLTLSNIKGFVQGNFRKIMNEFGEVPQYIKEQAIWRLHQVKLKSPECLKEDKCIHCGCQVSAKTWESRGCSNEEDPCYPPMMNEQEWSNFKIKEYERHSI